MSESFIYQAYISDLSLCDRLIQEYWDSPEKRPGCLTTKDGGQTVDTRYKDSTDVILKAPSAQEYFFQLNPIVEEYKKKYPQCDMYAPWGVLNFPAIQYYKPGGGFFSWHTERINGRDQVNASRHLVFMTYLNDVTDGGETEFQLQGLKIQPRKGLSLIWPADWTHTHRGVTSPTQEKLIVTGWFNFL